MDTEVELWKRAACAAVIKSEGRRGKREKGREENLRKEGERRFVQKQLSGKAENQKPLLAPSSGSMYG